MTQISDLRSTASTLFEAAIAAADPAAAVRRGFAEAPPPDTHPNGRTIVIAIGKAAPAMLREAKALLPRTDTALAVTHHENDATVPGAEIMRAGHPVPDDAGERAAQRVIETLESATEKDRVIALISGGGSALLPAPVPGVALGDKAKLNDLLLSAGLDIVKMNEVRQQVSRLKGGGFTQLAAPAPVAAYLLSDVIGDDLRAIASGPTVSPIGTPRSAIETLKTAGIWDETPASIQDHLTHQSHTSGTASHDARNTLVGSNRLSLQAMLAKAQELGFAAHIASDTLVGDVSTAAALIRDHMTTVSKPTALLFGGETTVKLTGTGRGGRNQELALRVALTAPDLLQSWVFLSGGTDGRDGPTNAAGGIVDASTAARIPNADALLANNDSYAALKAADALLITQATGTNVADVQVLLIAP